MDKERIKSVVRQMSLEEKMSVIFVKPDMRIAGVPRLKVKPIRLYEPSPFLYVPLAPLYQIASTFDLDKAREYGKARAKFHLNNDEAVGGLYDISLFREMGIFGSDMLFAICSGAYGVIPCGLIIENVICDSELKMIARLIGAKLVGALVIGKDALELMKELIKKFDGSIVCDYDCDTLEAINYYNTFVGASQKQILRAVSSGKIDEEKINAKCVAMLAKVVEFNEKSRSSIDIGAVKVGEDSVILLRNNGVLPVVNSEQAIAIIGEKDKFDYRCKTKVIDFNGGKFDKYLPLLDCFEKIIFVAREEERLPKRLLELLRAKGKKLILLKHTLGSFDSEELQFFDGIITIFACDDIAKNLLLDATFGKLNPTGRLPIDMGKLFRLGSGMEYNNCEITLKKAVKIPKEILLQMSIFSSCGASCGDVIEAVGYLPKSKSSSHVGQSRALQRVSSSACAKGVLEFTIKLTDLTELDGEKKTWILREGEWVFAIYISGKLLQKIRVKINRTDGAVPIDYDASEDKKKELFASAVSLKKVKEYLAEGSEQVGKKYLKLSKYLRKICFSEDSIRNAKFVMREMSLARLNRI